MSGENDEFHGVGGSYAIDPKTGKRELVERTQEADAVAVDQPIEEQCDGPSEA